MGSQRVVYDWATSLSLSPGDLPHPGIKPRSPALEADALTSEPPGNEMDKWHRQHARTSLKASYRVIKDITRLHLQTLWRRQNCTDEEQRTFCKGVSWQRVWLWEDRGRKCFRLMQLFWMVVVTWIYTSFKTLSSTLRNCTLFFKSINVYGCHFVSDLYGSGANLYISPVK